MWFRRILILICVLVLGIVGGWGVRRTWATLHPSPVVEPAPVVDRSPVESRPAARRESAVVDGGVPASVVPPHVVGVLQGRGRLIVSWSDGTSEGEDDFAAARKVVRLTRAAVWIDGERFPIKATAFVASASIPEPTTGVPAAAAGAVPASRPDDDPIWAYSQSSGSWYLRDRSMVPGR